MKVLRIAFLCLLFTSCGKQLDVDYIQSTGWIYSDGFRVTDFMDFRASTGFKIKNDTIVVNGMPRAVITNLDKENFDLEIRSLDGVKVGHYMDEREMLE